MRNEFLAVVAVLVSIVVAAAGTARAAGAAGASGASGAAGAAGATDAPREPTTRNVAIVLYEGVELLDFAGPGEVFAAAAGFGEDAGRPAFRVYTVAQRPGPITSQGFVRIVPEFTIDDAPPPDLVVIPGGNSGPLAQDAKFIEWVRQGGDARMLLTVCTGAFVAAKAGRLDGRPATTFYGAIDRLREVATKTDVQEGRRFIDSGSVITTAGVSAGIDGALHVVARLLGRAVADRTARYMEYHWTPEPYLAKNYSYLNPGTDARGRLRQQAALFEDEKDWAAAIDAWRRLTEQDAQDAAAWYGLARALHFAGRFDEAVAPYRRAAATPGFAARAGYNLACGLAVAGRRDEALAELGRAVDAGFRAAGLAAADRDLDSLRGDPRFAALLGRMGGKSNSGP